MGYSPKTRDGKKVYCKRDAELGTRLESWKCLPEYQVALLAKSEADNRNTAAEMQLKNLTQPPAIEPSSHAGH